MQSLKYILLLLTLPLLLHGEFLLHYRFEDADATIMDSGPTKCHGLYIPAADKDNDTP
jgi:hypothetical protein